jgi:hypothetical protein
MGLLAFGDGEGTWELWGELTRRRSEVALVLLLLLELLLVRVLSREVRVELVEVRLVRSGEVDMVGGRSGVVVIGGGGGGGSRRELMRRSDVKPVFWIVLRLDSFLDDDDGRD